MQVASTCSQSITHGHNCGTLDALYDAMSIAMFDLHDTMLETVKNRGRPHINYCGVVC